MGSPATSNQSPAVLAQNDGAANIGTSSGNDLQTELNLKATITYVDGQIASLVSSAPGALNTLNELAAALGDDENFASTMTAALAGKMPLAGGTFTGAVTLGNGLVFGARNAGDSATYSLLQVTGGNNALIGGNTANSYFRGGAISVFQIGGSDVFNIDANGLFFSAGGGARVNNILDVGDTSSDAAKELVTKNYVDSSGFEKPISSASPSGVAAVDIAVPSGYEEVRVKLQNILPATNGAALLLRTSSDGGSSFDSGATDYAHQVLKVSNNVNDYNSSGDTDIPLTQVGVNNTATYSGASGEIVIPQPDRAGRTSLRIAMRVGAGTSYETIILATGLRQSTSGIDYIRIFFDSGNIADGKIRVSAI